MQQFEIDYEGVKAVVTVRISSRAKKVSILVKSANSVELVVPKRSSQYSAMKFLDSKYDWIAEKIRFMPKEKRPIRFTNNKIIPILGKEYTILHKPELQTFPHLEGDYIIIPGLKKNIARNTRSLLLHIAYSRLHKYVEAAARKVGVEYGKITLRDQNTRWGSCSSDGNLSFSWRLVFAPKEIMQYIAIHEVCHLIHMNHSREFWALVRTLCPRYRSAEKWLHTYGNDLRRYG